MKSHQGKAIICGFPISTCNLQDNYELIIQYLKEERGQWVVTLNLEMIYRANREEAYRTLLHKADLFVADGVPLLWASNFKQNTQKIAGRSNGTDLVEKLLASGISFRVGVIGGTGPALVINKYNPHLLNDAYLYDGIVDLNDKNFLNELINNLKKHKTNLLFLNLGVPKQDALAQKIRTQNGSIIIIGVGGSFDLLSGYKPRAPKWMQKNGLEWFYRLLTEPKRLAKRYLLHYPQALYFLIKDLI